jgi:hypothetical protein
LTFNLQDFAVEFGFCRSLLFAKSEDSHNSGVATNSLLTLVTQAFKAQGCALETLGQHNQLNEKMQP